MQATFAKGDPNTGVDFALRVKTIRDPGLGQQIDQALFENARPDAAEHVLPAAPFDDDTVDVVKLQELRQQEPRRSAADNGYLGPFRHARFSRPVLR